MLEIENRGIIWGKNNSEGNEIPLHLYCLPLYNEIALIRTMPRLPISHAIHHSW